MRIEYNLKWMRGHPLLVYLSISSILKSGSNPVAGALSKSSQLVTPYEIIICRKHYSSLSIHARVSSVAEIGTIAGDMVTFA